MRETDLRFKHLMTGALAGLLATLPMTIFMQVAWRRMPAREWHPLPPRQITRKLLQEADLRRRVNHPVEITVTWLLHFVFGSLAGMLFTVLGKRLPPQEPFKGMLQGIALWFGSYLGWIPALGILPPATRQPWRMNFLMIVAHFIWGISLGLLEKIISSKTNYIEL